MSVVVICRGAVLDQAVVLTRYVIRGLFIAMYALACCVDLVLFADLVGVFSV